MGETWRTLGRGCTVLCIALIGLVTLTPGRYDGPQPVSPVPLASTYELATDSASAAVAVVNIAGNILLFVPLGAALMLALHGRHRSFVLAVAAGFALSMAIEIAQFTVVAGRATDIDDVLLNTGGTAAGAALVRILVGFVSSWRRGGEVGRPDRSRPR